MNTLPFLSFALKLEDLLGRCEHPADKPHAREWLDATKDDLRAAAQAAGAQSRHDQNLAGKVERAERLSLKLATLLHSHPDIATKPVERWTMKLHRDLVDELADLERQFREIGETERAEPKLSPIVELVAEDATDKVLRELRTVTAPPDNRTVKEQIGDFAFAVADGFVPAFVAAHRLKAVLPGSPEWNKEADSLIACLTSTCRKLDHKGLLRLAHKASRWLHQHGLPTDYRITITESFGTQRLHQRSACETMLVVCERMLRGAYKLKTEPVPTTEGLNGLLKIVNASRGFTGETQEAQPGSVEAHHIWQTLGIADWQECNLCATAANAECHEMLAQLFDSEPAPAAGGDTPAGADQTPKRVEGKDAPDDDSQSGGRKMPDRFRLALASWRYACEKWTELHDKTPTYKQAHQWLRAEGQSELEVHSDRSTWERYIRAAEQWENGNQNTARGGRTGRSIIHHSERDSRDKLDE